MEGKITVNIWIISRGNQFWCELARASSYRGYELSTESTVSTHDHNTILLACLFFRLFPTGNALFSAAYLFCFFSQCCFVFSRVLIFLDLAR